MSRVVGAAPLAGGRAQGFYWAINPYSGCEFACTYCHARGQAPFADADFKVFERDILVRVNTRELVAKLLADRAHLNVPLVLGTSTDPWQPAEKKVLATRAVLQELAQHDGVDLRAQTRSSIAARDADLLGQIGRRGKVAVSFSIGTLDRRLARLLEPLAPSPDLRFIAMEALARAGVKVGLVASPILPGLNDTLSALRDLARRARDAGASFVSAAPLVMAPQARARVVQHVSKFDPELATRYDRLLARTAEYEQGFPRKLQQRFAEACEQVGLPVFREEPEAQPETAAAEPPKRRMTPPPVQLELW
ncbi:MAG: radical SAM protein [Myxococcales bacterium]